MLGYQSTSFHDALYLRDVLGLAPAPEFAQWLTEAGLLADGRIAAEAPRALGDWVLRLGGFHG
jgi:ethanolamine ammonia-lyase large subunit